MSGDLIIINTKPDPEPKLPALRKALDFLKFTPSETESIVSAVSDTADIVGGIVSIVGTVNSVLSVMKALKILGTQPSATDLALEHIGTRVEQIYGYLASEAIISLHRQAGAWRVVISKAKGELYNTQISRTAAGIGTLEERGDELDSAILTMLEPSNASIPFLRQSYGYVPNVDLQNFPQWINAAKKPYMSTADGKPLIADYSDTAQELQSRIFDAGYYLDVLVSALRLRMLILMTIEPAFRGTGHDRLKLDQIADALELFCKSWRDSMIVAVPSAGFEGGLPGPFGVPISAPGLGVLQNPFRPGARFSGSREAPEGIVVGTIDPTSGVADWDPFWSGFAVVGQVSRTDLGVVQSAWGGGYDVTLAKDLPTALSAAKSTQAETVVEVQTASGLSALEQLLGEFRNAAKVPEGSDFARLSDAKFSRAIVGRSPTDGRPLYAIRDGDEEQVGLGRLAPYSSSSHPTYTGKRHYQDAEKEFHFAVAQRGDSSHVQLGYRLEVAGESIPLIAFSRVGFGDDHSELFAARTFDTEIKKSITVYDAYQSHVFSMKEEDLFEEGKPIPAPQAANPVLVAQQGWRGRLFLNPRQGKISLLVTVDVIPPGPDEYAGSIKVKVACQAPEDFPDSSIVAVSVFETHVNRNGAPEEYLAGQMPIHIVPSFVTLGTRFFDDYWAAFDALAKSIRQVDVQLKAVTDVPRHRDPRPAWQIGALEHDKVLAVDRLEKLRADHPDLVRSVISRNVSPE